MRATIQPTGRHNPHCDWPAKRRSTRMSDQAFRTPLVSPGRASMFHKNIRLRSASTALATLLAGASLSTLPVPLFAESPSAARLTDTVRAIRAAEAAVVNIEGNNLAAKARARPSKSTAWARRVIIDSRGYILTNQHVVQDVNRIEVTLHDGAKFIGAPIAHDPSTDLALIKIDAPRPVPVINFGTSSDLMRGEKSCGHWQSLRLSTYGNRRHYQCPASRLYGQRRSAIRRFDSNRRQHQPR